MRGIKGLDGSNPLLSAKQSAIFAFSAGKSKIVRMFAYFVRPKGTGEAQIQPSAANLCPILSVENRTGALRAIVSALFSGTAVAGRTAHDRHAPT